MRLYKRCNPRFVGSGHWNKSRRYTFFQAVDNAVLEGFEVGVCSRRVEVQEGVEVKVSDACYERVDVSFSHIVDFVSG